MPEGLPSTLRPGETSVNPKVVPYLSPVLGVEQYCRSRPCRTYFLHDVCLYSRLSTRMDPSPPTVTACVEGVVQRVTGHPPPATSVSGVTPYPTIRADHVTTGLPTTVDQGPYVFPPPPPLRSSCFHSFRVGISK